MARYKHIDTSPRFLAVDLQQHLRTRHIDARFCNDATGAAAYPPAMLLKIVLFAYSRPNVALGGITPEQKLA